MRKPQSGSYKYKKVLLIDENEIDNFINERIISTSNFAEDIIVKDSGAVALAFLEEAAKKQDKLPQIIFLDLNMPVMDGFEFLDKYEVLSKQFPSLKEQCKIIVLSSSISPADIDRASTNPFVYKYINKPLSEKYLEAINF